MAELNRAIESATARWWVLRVTGGTGARPRVPLRLRWGRRIPFRADSFESVDDTPPRTLPRVALLLPDQAALGQVGRHPIALSRVRQVRIEIAHWRIPARGWVGRMGTVQDLRRVEVQVPGKDGRVRIAIELGRERPLREVLAAVEGVLMPNAPLPLSHTVSFGSQGRLPRWIPIGADIATRMILPPGSEVPPGVDPVSGKPRDSEDPLPNRPAVDAELYMGAAKPSGSIGLVATAVLHATDEEVASGTEVGQAVVPSPTFPVLVDVRGQHHPWLPPRPKDPHVVLELRRAGSGVRWRPRLADVSRAQRPKSDATMGSWQALDVLLPGPDVERTRWQSIGWDVADGLAPAAVAAAVVRAALSGVVLDGRGLPRDIEPHLAPELAELVREPLPAADDPLAWELRSIRQRRAAVRGHAAPMLLDGIIRPDAAVHASRPSVSALLVTRRPAQALSVLRVIERQSYPDLEVVLAIHGVPHDPDLERAVAESERPIETVMVPPEATLGEALGIATARARGSLVIKFDDDDLYSLEHVWDLVVGRAISGATVIGKASQLVWLEATGVLVRRERPLPNVYGRVVGGGTILVGRGDLEAMGGWRPVRSGVDRGLLDRTLQAGGSIYQQWPFGFIYVRHGEAHTWDVGDDYFLRGVSQRWDGIPDLPEFPRP
ncbi:MAG: hypothetical protein ABWZ82_02725 [Candidatus Limnocylindrales bacterium]